MDYRALLKKYMDRVGHMEGVYYLPICMKDIPGWSGDEIRELDSLSEEVTAEYLERRTKGQS